MIAKNPYEPEVVEACAAELAQAIDDYTVEELVKQQLTEAFGPTAAAIEAEFLHPVHRYGCYNRPPFAKTHEALRRDHEGIVRTFLIRNVMSTDCQYSKVTVDPRCDGCKHHAREFDKAI